MAVVARSLCRLSLVVTLLGCGHGPAPKWNETSNQLCQGKVCYKLGEPGAGWQQVHKEGAAVGFYNPDLGAVLEANATCRDDAEAAPLSSLTRQLLIGYTDRTVHSEEKIPLAGREALRTRVDAKLDGVPVALDLVVLRRNGCIYDLTYVAPPARYDEGKDDFDRFFRGFVDERKQS